jgi:phage terminase small subunit
MANINEKRQLFCEEYLRNGFKSMDAYQFVYPSASKRTASVEANKLLKKPAIQDYLEKAGVSYRVTGYQVGINREIIMNKLKEMMEAKKKEKDGTEVPDYTAINNAIATYAKLTGDFVDRKSVKYTEDKDEEEFDPEKLTPEQRKELKEKILKEL